MKRLIYLLICVLTAGNTLAQDGRLPFLLDKLHDGGRSNYTMVIAHRGDWRHAPENSLQGFKNCIDYGVDVIEVDLSETKDGELIVMHDATLDRTTNGSGKVADHTLQQIKALKLRGGNHVLTRHPVPSFEELLMLAKGNILIQVDKWQPIREKILALAHKHGCLNQLIFRGTAPADQVKSLFGEALGKINYIPVITGNGGKDLLKLQDYLSNMNMNAIGIAFNKDDLPILNEVPKLQQQNIRVWFNSILGNQFNAGHDDDLSVTDLDASYGWLLKKGANMIMTDRPFALIDYLKTKQRR